MTVDDKVIVETSLSTDQTKIGTMMLVSIDNQSGFEICLSNDLLKNSASYAMNINVKDSRGHLLEKLDFGLIPPPIPGETRLKPGSKIQSAYNFGERFDLEGSLKRTSQYFAIAQFNFWRCEDRSWWSAKSDWKLFEYQVNSK